MPEFEKLLIFLCSGAAKAGNKKLSYRIATRLEALGIAGIGTLQDLSEQDVSPYLTTAGFDIDNYIHSEIFPKLNDKWSYSLSLPNHSVLIGQKNDWVIPWY